MYTFALVLLRHFPVLQIPVIHLQLGGGLFQNHAHCTKYAGQVSADSVIQASIIQGSVIGTASYVVTAADLHPIHDRNRIFKFADVSGGRGGDTAEARRVRTLSV